jgi:hypothetical protein
MLRADFYLRIFLILIFRNLLEDRELDEKITLRWISWNQAVKVRGTRSWFRIVSLFHISVFNQERISDL